MPKVARINTTPLKGTALQHVTGVSLTGVGIGGDRRFHLVDDRGRLVSGSVHGPLVKIEVSHDRAAGTLTCRFPDGTVASGGDEALGYACETDFYGRPVPGHRLEGPLDAAFSAFVGRPVFVVRTDRDGDGVDVLPVTVISTASVAELGRRGGFEGALEALRFRINLELDGCDPFQEDTWDGMRVRFGEAVLRIGGQIPRCVVTTQDPRTGLHDWNTLKQIASFRSPMPDRVGIPFGVYATVEVDGEVTVGDEVALLDI